MDTSNWMNEIWDDMKTKEIFHILLPGTHNSGSFSVLNTPPVRNQGKNIKQQLEGGIRYFDISITKKKRTGTIVMHHGSYPPDRSQNFEPALKQMASFATSHRHEIFVVSLSEQIFPTHKFLDLNLSRVMIVLMS